jgi:hypothetical protein
MNLVSIQRRERKTTAALVPYIAIGMGHGSSPAGYCNALGNIPKNGVERVTKLPVLAPIGASPRRQVVLSTEQFETSQADVLAPRIDHTSLALADCSDMPSPAIRRTVRFTIQVRAVVAVVAVEG